MSYAAIKWTYLSPMVLKASLAPTDLAVLRALCWLYKDVDATRMSINCYPGVARLAKLTGLKAGAINAAKRRLQEKGLISWTRAANFPGRPMRTNCYQINCPGLEKILKKNEYKDTTLSEEALENWIPPLKPGMDYTRPDIKALIKDYGAMFPVETVNWLADALAFVCDRPENRKSLEQILLQKHPLAELQAALERVRAASVAGHQINNRMGYLVKTIRNAAADRKRTRRWPGDIVVAKPAKR